MLATSTNVPEGTKLQTVLSELVKLLARDVARQVYQTERAASAREVSDA